MNESKINAINPETGRSSIIRVKKREALGGGKEKKFRITGEVERVLENPSSLLSRLLKKKKVKEVSLIERHSSEKLSQDIYRKWLAFRRAKLPVVPTLRMSRDGVTLATDLKADGSEIYGQGIYIPTGDLSEKVKNPTILDKLFVELYPQIKNDIWNKCLKLASQAALAKIVLPLDDPVELIFHPDGRWELMTLDLSNARIDQTESTDFLQNTNKSLLREFMEDLDFIFTHLSKA